MESDSAFTVKDLDVNGREIMEYLGLKPGPGVGVLLDDLLETVLDDPDQNKKELLLKIAAELYHSRINMD